MTVDMLAKTNEPTRQVVLSYLRKFSLETMPRDKNSIDAAINSLPSGRRVYVACAPGESHDRIIEGAVKLSHGGLVPVPHVVARGFRDEHQLDEFLARIRGETGTTSALVLGGDISASVGCFESSQQLVETGLFEKHGFRSLSFATYPENHPRIGSTTLDAALIQKVRLANAQSLDVSLVTQFCFDAEAIVGHVRRLRKISVHAPVHLGVVGPASARTVLKFAALCGIGNSIRALTMQGRRLSRLVGDYDPLALITRLARATTMEPGLDIAGLHFFTFSGVAQTVEWSNRIVLE